MEKDEALLSCGDYPDDSWESHLKSFESEEEMGGIHLIPSRKLIYPKCPSAEVKGVGH
jgi:hypothetical protein